MLLLFILKVSKIVPISGCFYNIGQNICRIFLVLKQFLFITSETELRYYYQKLNVRVESRVAERHKTQDPRAKHDGLCLF